MVRVTAEGYYVNKRNQEKKTIVKELIANGYNHDFFTKPSRKDERIVNPFEDVRTPTMKVSTKKDPFDSTVDSMTYSPVYFAMKKQ